jgi:hypothetical protein
MYACKWRHWEDKPFVSSTAEASLGIGLCTPSKDVWKGRQKSEYNFDECNYKIWTNYIRLMRCTPKLDQPFYKRPNTVLPNVLLSTIWINNIWLIVCVQNMDKKFSKKLLELSAAVMKPVQCRSRLWKRHFLMNEKLGMPTAKPFPAKNW